MDSQVNFGEFRLFEVLDVDENIFGNHTRDATYTFSHLQKTLANSGIKLRDVTITNESILSNCLHGVNPRGVEDWEKVLSFRSNSFEIGSKTNNCDEGAFIFLYNKHFRINIEQIMIKIVEIIQISLPDSNLVELLAYTNVRTLGWLSRISRKIKKKKTC